MIGQGAGMLIFLALQSLIFSAWVVVSLGNLFSLAGFAIESRRGLLEGMAERGLLHGFLSDPVTAFRRKAWLGLTVALLLCGAVTTGLYLTA